VSRPTLDLLIPTIPHRHHQLLGLLESLDQQMVPGVGVRVFRDNLQDSIGAKRRALLESSAADYVACIDDDDQVAPDYIDAVTAALAGRPDYVGFIMLFTCNWASPQVTRHSLEHEGWSDGPAGPARDISHLNPVRRELALLGAWEGGYGEDRRWAAALRASGRVRTEVMIDRWMYRYRFDENDCAEITREPWAGPVPDLPGYPWLIPVGPGAGTVPAGKRVTKTARRRPGGVLTEPEFTAGVP
jgi:glycosyltransferase involved in cell wall biosynthesis